MNRKRIFNTMAALFMAGQALAQPGQTGSVPDAPAVRRGASVYKLPQGGQWILPYLEIQGSANRVESSPEGVLVQRRFVCAPQPEELATKWQHACQGLAGQFKLQMQRGCEPKADEAAQTWVQRCARRYGND